jgi:cell division septation protein DedD
VGEIVIALFALTGFYYYLSGSPPVLMPERPIASAPEVLAALPVPVPPSVVEEATGVGEQVVTIAVLPPAESVMEAVGEEDISVPAENSASSPVKPVIIAAGDYVLHIDLLRSQNRLEALNFESRIEVVSRPTPIFRVFLGPFAERRKALAMMAVSREKGDDPFLLIRHGAYNVVIGSFYLQSSVDAWEKLYRAAGFTPKVQKVTIKMPHSLLLLDGPRVQQDADAVLAQLYDAGFPDARLR